MRIRISWVLLILLGFGLLIAGCQPEEEEEEFDEAALIAVRDYIEEMSAALLDELLEADLKGWVRDHYEDDLPLRYDQERRQWLADHQAALESLRDKHRDKDFPALEEIAAWQVVVVRGDKEWLLEGAAVIEALEKLDRLYLEVTGAIEMIIEAGGELDMNQSERILALLESIEPQVEEIRAVLSQ